MAKPQVGIQLYTLRDQTENDFLGTIKKVAEIGYSVVEFAGYFGTPAKELKKVLDDTGLKAPSAHIGLNWEDPSKRESELAAQIEYAQEIGLSYIVTPYAPLPENPTMADVDQFVSVIEKAAQQVTAAGLKYGYHNHAFEFKQVEGKAVIDHLLERVPADLLFAEFDLGWVHMGGQKPVDYINKYAGRVPLAHFKDFGDGRSDTEIGRGVVDFDSVLAVSEQAGILYYIVEQEQFEGSSLDSAAISLEFFKQRGII
ncbi:sugar phosphate isomerase/epimerase family protein [Paenibacillus abyssi]|uniref:Sugar phosphate isomerase n=1 Tax=Paenibacillus abyssi TaxID=1340531 RepID=A0A917CZ06_9BACL|nr:sugar phosphate isomerase [Paenibacillus abyssi]